MFDILSGLSLEVRESDPELALKAGALGEVTRPLGLLLGDRDCLALGIAEGAPILATGWAWAGVPIKTTAEVVIVRRDYGMVRCQQLPRVRIVNEKDGHWALTARNVRSMVLAGGLGVGLGANRNKRVEH